MLKREIPTLILRDKDCEKCIPLNKDWRLTDVNRAVIFYGFGSSECNVISVTYLDEEMAEDGIPKYYFSITYVDLTIFTDEDCKKVLRDWNWEYTPDGCVIDEEGYQLDREDSIVFLADAFATMWLKPSEESEYFATFEEMVRCVQIYV